MNTEPVPESGTFSEWAWASIAPIRAAIDAHPFLRELESGELSQERFDGYLTQDALYLAAFARALAAAASQAMTAEEAVFWASSARDAILVERSLHESRIGDVEVTAAVASPTTTAYTNHLLALAAGGCYPTLVAGLLPCFWIYEDVGRRVRGRLGDLAGHPYADWIGQYGDPAFAATAAEAIASVDRLAAASSPDVWRRMLGAFQTAARYEWMFWDAAYRQETWPV